MILQKFKTPGLAQMGYLLGHEGEAVVIDPRRDITCYLEAAAQHDFAIRFVLETHRQEDYVVGSTELARVTGAKIVNGADPLFGRGDIRLADGETLSLRGMTLKALHTPGHTPESMCYAIYLESAPDVAWAVFTGDALFIGETGRTDLPDPLRTGENAGLLYDALHAKVLPLGDQALVLPAHGAGSVCGGRIADRDESTLGIERSTNAVFRVDRATFVNRKVAERIPRPPYFRRMEQLNLKGGARISQAWAEIPLLGVDAFARTEGALVIDTRTPEAFASGHVPGALSIPLATLSVFAGWVHDGAAPILLVLRASADLEAAVLALQRVGIDAIAGVLAGGFEAWRNAGRPVGQTPALTVDDLRHRPEVVVLDVRDDTEFEEGHIPGAAHVYVGYVQDAIERARPPISRDQEFAVTCSVGNRASLAVSLLRRLGFKRPRNLLGGMKAWTQSKGEVQEAHNTLTTEQVEGPRR